MRLAYAGVLLALGVAVYFGAGPSRLFGDGEDPDAMAAQVLRMAGPSSLRGRRAVVVGGTSGIGRGVAVSLARADASVTVVGRSATRGGAVVAEMQAAAPPGSQATFKFVPCDCFSLDSVRGCVAALADSDGGDMLSEPLDYLVLTQGMATMQGFTPTADGLDQKLQLHVYSRAAFALGLLPRLRRAADPRVLTVLSAGVHGVYRRWDTDVSLSGGSYSIKNAADAAGMYNDIMVDSLSREEPSVTFMHAAPGFVNTNWGTEMPMVVRWLVRALQPLGRSISKCGEYMAGGMLNPEHRGGFRLLDQYGRARASKTTAHDEARESVWAHITATVAVTEQAEDE